MRKGTMTMLEVSFVPAGLVWLFMGILSGWAPLKIVAYLSFIVAYLPIAVSGLATALAGAEFED